MLWSTTQPVCRCCRVHVQRHVWAASPASSSPTWRYVPGRSLNGGTRRTKACVRASAVGQRVTVADDLIQRYRVLEDPAGHDTRAATALQAFTRSSILAFECNWSEASIASELAEHPECSLYCCIVWLTLLQLPRKTVARLQLPSSGAGASATVSAETTALWGGFVQMIVMGYLDKRWAWYDLSRLQLEILVSTGRRMPPAAVAELAQLVYTTLHQVAPQWPTK